MSLPPQANLFAVHHREPASLDALDAKLQESGEFVEVWRPIEGWVAAVRPLPDSSPDGETARKSRLAFAEGRELFGGAASANAPDAFKELANTAENSPERLASCTGDFGFIHFQKKGAATVARSCGGLAPFYLWRSGGSVAVSTRLGYLVRFISQEFSLDPLVNALWAAGWTWFPGGRTFLRAVRILNRGHFARIGPGFVRCGEYWNPRPDIPVEYQEKRFAEHAEHLRGLLVRNLSRELDVSGGNLLSLSGGVDSSSLAALASGAAGRSVWTVSVLPSSDDAYRREMAYISPLASKFKFDRQWEHRITRQSYLDLMRKAPKAVFHLTHPVLCALPDIVRQAPVKVLFGGEFADQLCGSVTTRPDLIDQTTLAGLLSRFGEAPFGPTLLASVLKRRCRLLLGTHAAPVPFPADLPELFHPDARAECRTLFQSAQRRANRDRAPWGYLARLSELDGWTAMNWEAASELEIRRSFPFFCREMIELTHECHPAELYGHEPKRLLREALANDVPGRNLSRDDKGAWGRYLTGSDPWPWQSRTPESLAQILREDWSPQPPKEIDFNSARMLTRLLVFEETFRETRTGGPGSRRGG